MTMIGQEVPVSQEVTPPRLIVAIAGQALKTYTLSKTRVTIGRAEDNEIVIEFTECTRVITLTWIVCKMVTS